MDVKGQMECPSERGLKEAKTNYIPSIHFVGILQTEKRITGGCDSATFSASDCSKNIRKIIALLCITCKEENKTAFLFAHALRKNSSSIICKM